MKKLFMATALLLALLLALSACADGGDSSSSASPSSSGSTASASTPQDGGDGEEELSWSGEITFAPYMFAPYDEAQDIVVGEVEKILREKYDIDVTLTNVYVEYPQYKELINMRIAGGTAPDIWLGQNESGIRDYYNQGLIASWDRSFFEKYAPNLNAYINGGGAHGDRADIVDTWWAGACIGTPDGKMITMPQMIGKSAIPKAMIYRGDWIDNLGVDPENLPSNIDDFIELMYRFKNEDPDGNGQNDTYAFSTSTIKYFLTAFGSYSGFPDSFNSQWYLQDDGVVRNADILPGVKEALTILQELYADGLIDPEFSAKTGENTGGYWAISQGFINGLYGVSGHASMDHYRKREVLNDAGGPVAQEYWAINGEDSDFYFGPWIVGPYGDYGHYVDNDYGLGESYVYNIALEQEPAKLATIFKIMDAFCVDDELAILAEFGIEGETFEYNDFGGISSLITNEELNAKGVAVLRSVYGPNYVYNENVIDIMFYKNPAQLVQMEVQEKPFFDSYLKPDITGWPPSQAEYSADLIAFRDETYIGIIKGDLEIDYFDTFVEEWLSRGGQVLQDEANALYAEQNA